MFSTPEYGRRSELFSLPGLDEAWVFFKILYAMPADCFLNPGWLLEKVAYGCEELSIDWTFVVHIRVKSAHDVVWQLASDHSAFNFCFSAIN